MSPRAACWCGSRKKAFNAKHCAKHVEPWERDRVTGQVVAKDIEKKFARQG